MKLPNLTLRLFDEDPPSRENDIALVGDLTGNGLDDIIIGAKRSAHTDAHGGDADHPTVHWYEAPTFQRHPLGYGNLEAGGVLCDLTGSGRPDLVAGEQGHGRHLFWWENPAPHGDPRQPWTRRVITDAFERYHDQAFGDLDGDGRPELVVLSQNVRKLVWFEIPADPRVEPWPADHCHVIDDDVAIEGLRLADVDGDGRTEIIAGHLLYKPGDDPRQPWTRRELLPELKWARAALGDLNGNGHLDLVLAEAENPDARLLWLEGPDFTRIHDLGSDFFHLHSLEVADFNGSGALDIFAAEMHLGRNPEPRLFLFLNDGRGNFTRHPLRNPSGTHESKLIRCGPGNLPGIINKPYAPHHALGLWENNG